MSERKRELGRPGTPFQGAVCLTMLVPLQFLGATSPRFLSLQLALPLPHSLCAVETPGHCSWGNQVIAPMGYKLKGIAVVRVTGHFGPELFIAALNISQRQDVGGKLSERKWKEKHNMIKTKHRALRGPGAVQGRKPRLQEG